tara:strand:- start:10397 stop:10939 length:543 start_codon:yes stop_codon:yes gene_type:complete
MALTVEDGTGVAGADSYISVAYATAYHANLGNDKWTFLSGSQEVALRVATLSLDLLYAQNFKGNERFTSQELRYPRSSYSDNYDNFVAEGVIPTELKNAVAEAALIYIVAELNEPGTGSKALVQDPDPQAYLQSISESFDGVCAESKTYFRPVSTTKLIKVSLMLYPHLLQHGASPLVRG